MNNEPHKIEISLIFYLMLLASSVFNLNDNFLRVNTANLLRNCGCFLHLFFMENLKLQH